VGNRHVSVIVPVLNSPQLVMQFWIGLTSFNNHDIELIFVDNGSNGITKNVLHQCSILSPVPVIVMTNPTNIGFGPASNQGARMASGDILIFTQPDVVIHGSFDSALEPIDNGVLYGPRLLAYDTGWNKFGSVVVPYLEGWFLVCTRTTWNILGGFDERYVPADFEDIDLAYLAKQMGMVLTERSFPVRHNHPGSSAWNQFPNRVEVTKANQERFRQKWSL